MLSLTTIGWTLINSCLSVTPWFDNINLVAVLVVSCQVLKIMNFFDRCKNVVLENKTNEQIQYLWETKRPILLFISSLHHLSIHHFYIAPLVGLKSNIMKYQYRRRPIDNISDDIHATAISVLSINCTHTWQCLLQRRNAGHKQNIP